MTLTDTPSSRGSVRVLRLRGFTRRMLHRKTLSTIDSNIGCVWYRSRSSRMAEVRSGETHRPAQPSEPSCGPVVPDRPHRRVFVTQSPFKAPKLARRRRDFSVLIQSAVARPPPVARERTGGLPFGDPVRQLLRRTIAVVKTRGGVGEIEGEQASFVGGQHGSLRIEVPGRAYRANASDMDVLVEFGDGLSISEPGIESRRCPGVIVRVDTACQATPLHLRISAPARAAACRTCTEFAVHGTTISLRHRERSPYWRRTNNITVAIRVVPIAALNPSAASSCLSAFSSLVQSRKAAAMHVAPRAGCTSRRPEETGWGTKCS